MILSRSRNFVFIKGRKVAGTSVEMALSTLCGPGDIVTPITPRDERVRLEMGGRPANFANDPDDEPDYIAAVSMAGTAALAGIRHPRGHFTNHMGLEAVIARQPEAATMPIVFVERNPYAKVLSLANHQASFTAYQSGGTMLASADDVRRNAAALIGSGEIAAVLNIWRYRTGPGAPSGTMIRYENLTGDYEAFVRSLGAEPAPLPHAKRGPQSNSRAPEDFISRHGLDQINAIFAEEFEVFGYEVL